MENNQQNFEFIVEEKDPSLRLDKFLSQNLPNFSRNQIQEWIEDGRVTRNQKIIKNSASKLDQGIYQISVPAAKPMDLTPFHMELNIVYEDDYLLVINKPAGLTVHPGAGNTENTLVNVLIAQAELSLSSIGGFDRPGIVHRLDKDTSGLMLVAKTDTAHQFLAKQLEDHSLARTYHAVCLGNPIPMMGTIKTNIDRSQSNRLKMANVKAGGKVAITHYKIIKRLANNLLSIVECKLETGRTHQIRLHMSSINCPIAGDKLYNNLTHASLGKLNEEARLVVKSFPRQALHAKKISFIHPHTEELMEFETELPTDIADLIKYLENVNLE